MEATTLSQKRIFHDKRRNAWHSVRHGARRKVVPHANFADFGGNRQTPEAQCDGITAHTRQKQRYLKVISRRTVPLNEKWGKSSVREAREKGKRFSILQACRKTWQNVKGGYPSVMALYQYCHNHVKDF